MVALFLLCALLGLVLGNGTIVRRPVYQTWRSSVAVCGITLKCYRLARFLDLVVIGT